MYLCMCLFLSVLIFVLPSFDALLGPLKIPLNDTVGTLITHTPRWTVQAMGLKGLWVAGGGKEISAHKSPGNLRNICTFCYNKFTRLEGKQSVPSRQVIIDAFLFSSVSFMIEE